MIVSQVVCLSSLHSVVPFTTFALPILHHDSNQESRTAQRTHPDQTKACPIAGRISRCFRREENIARDNTTRVAKSDHHCGRYGSFIVATHIVVYPGDGYGLAGIATADDEEDSGVLCPDGDVRLVHEHCVASCGNENADDTEGVAMSEEVGAPGYADADEGCNDYRVN